MISDDKKKIIHSLFNSKGLCGLVNMGNTCYMNTAITCLSNTLPSTFYFLNKHHLEVLKQESKEADFLLQWVRLIDGIWEDNCTISPQSFIESTKILSFKTDNIFHFRHQQDVSEFIIFIINNIHEALAQKTTIHAPKSLDQIDKKYQKLIKESINNWSLHFKDSYSFIIELFYGQFVSIIQTIDNLPIENSFSYEPFCTLELEIPSQNCTIYDCFDLMTQESMLIGENKWFSDTTKNYRDAKRNILILRNPNILVICLKRFNSNNSKKKNLVEFPINNLDLSKYILRLNNQESKYNLYAIANHIGDSNFGHYMSYCKNYNNKWYKYDDDSVIEIEEKYLVSTYAYCLFYQINK